MRCVQSCDFWQGRLVGALHASPLKELALVRGPSVKVIGLLWEPVKLELGVVRRASGWFGWADRPVAGWAVVAG